MTRFYLLTMLFTCICISVNALEIINTNGISKEYDNAGLYKHERQELKTSREKDGVVRLNNWQGFRFDVWLKEQDLGQFSNIRFESEDKYLVTLSSEEFQAMESWIVVAQDEKDFEGNSLRLIFPSLREMQWVRDLSRVVLENFKALPYPSKFMLMKPFLDSQNLLNEPKPFVNTEGWYFSEFLPQLSESKEHQVVFYSRDGLKQNLNYPYHLEGAVLEKTKEDTYNLKSPQIPGGMWLRDIVYLQCDGTALIEQSSLNSLIALHKLLGWDSNPGLSFSIHKADEVLQLGFADALAEPQVFEGALFFELK